MKLKIAICICVLTILYSEIYSQTIEKLISNNAIEIKENNSFEKLKPILKDKRIIILGEASHWDGSTFETKGRLIEYLSQELKFNTIAMEGASFMSTMISQQMNSQKNLDVFLLPVWQTKECNKLISIINSKKHDVFGFDCQTSINFKECLKFLFKSDDIDYEKLNTIYTKLWMTEKVLKYNNLTLSEEEEIYFIETFDKLKNRIDKQLSTNKNNQPNLFTIKQIIKNIETEYRLSKIFKNDPNSGNDDIIITYNNIRDAQMADNVIWYLDHNPDKKIIIWCANFHGARDISQSEYPQSPTMYARQKLMGEHLSERYGDQLYSLAFTSLNTMNDTIEREIANRGIEYGFLDFSPLRFQNDYFDKPFKSCAIGYKSGKWMNIFDGIYFIKNQKKSTPIIQ